MSLYDEALSAGAPSLVDQIRQRWGSSWKPQEITDLAQILSARGVTDLSQLQFTRTQRDKTDLGGFNPDDSEITRSGVVPGSTFAPGKYDAWDVSYGGKPLGNGYAYQGDANNDGTVGKLGGGGDLSRDQTNPDMLAWSARGDGQTKFNLTQRPDGSIAVVPAWESSSDADFWRTGAVSLGLMFAGGYGSEYLQAANAASGATGGMTAADAAAMDAAMIDMGAGATNVGGAAVGETALGMSAAEQAAFLEANAGALAPGGEIATGYGTTWGVGADGIIGQGATMTADGVALDQIANNYGSQNLVDSSLTEPVTPPPGPTTPNTPVTPPPGTNTVTPPVTTPTSTPNIPIDPSKISDWASLFNVLSGLYGLKLAGDAAEKSDPFGPYRKGYADRLQALEANPGLLKSTPGYLGGLDAIQRQMAAKGYLGSGNMAGALMRYSGDSYHNEANRLATLAGANIGPGQTYFNQAQLTGQALSNIGYGLMPYMQGGPR